MPIKITMPALSPTMSEGTLAKWLVAEGDTVNAGDVMAEIETDKATMEFEAVDEGVIGKILVEAGTEGVAVNTPIAVLLDEGESADVIKDMDLSASNDPKPSAKNRESKGAHVSQASTVHATTAQSISPKSDVRSGGVRIFVSPLARRIAAQNGLDLSSVKGSGPRGRIVKRDVEQALNNHSNVPAISGRGFTQSGSSAGGYTEIPHNNIKKVTAKRLLESKTTVPHFYLNIDCQLDALLAARKDINVKANGEYKLSVNDFIIKAAAMALKTYPAANVSWTDEALLQYEAADISVAVSTPNGLITPIVRQAEQKGLRAISEDVKDLAGRAREGKLKPEEFQGGSFTISNLGMYGIKDFAAIINPPQACILAVGVGEPRPVVENGEIKIRNVMTCTLSVDHRAVDGAAGAEFLQHFKAFVENPVSMLV